MAPAIPRFLPQQIWRGTVFQFRALAPKPSSFLYTPIIPLVPHHRHHHNRNCPSLSSSLLPLTSKSPSSSPTSSIFTRPVPFLLNRCYKNGNKKNSGNVSTIAWQKFSFSTALRWGRDHHFDTLKVVQRLKDEGFSEEQSRAMMLVLSDVIEESIQNLTRTMVLREGSAFYLFPPNFPPFGEFTVLQKPLPTIVFTSTTLSLSSSTPPWKTLSNAPFSKKKKKIRCRPQHLFIQSRLYQTPLRASSGRLQRNHRHTRLARTPQQRHCQAGLPPPGRGGPRPSQRQVGPES